VIAWGDVGNLAFAGRRVGAGGMRFDSAKLGRALAYSATLGLLRPAGFEPTPPGLGTWAAARSGSRWTRADMLASRRHLGRLS
jgi:hypothetical protein